MAKKDFLQQKYCEINQLKNLLQTYPKEYCETMEKVFDEIIEYLDEEKNKLKIVAKKVQNKRVFTVDELSKHNGKNGAKSYIAVGGIVYDVTGVSKWSGGNHYGITAGRVLDKEFAQGHGNRLSIMEYAPAVGVLDTNNKRGEINSDKNPKLNSNSREELRYYKLQDISKFDGKNGNLAYVVINGTVYDVTCMRHWLNGNHYGLSAGKDLTEYFETCHKDEKDILKELRIVGTIIE